MISNFEIISLSQKNQRFRAGFFTSLTCVSFASTYCAASRAAFKVALGRITAFTFAVSTA